MNVKDRVILNPMVGDNFGVFHHLINYNRIVKFEIDKGVGFEIDKGVI